ncbi:hypothetical protein F0562_013907 [Nyssa sinensis]|uniref:RNase H type-1 domain-containing protein n=1 Tax=Nyssa sinensis TaxID=561372 RepID=A0A5J4ZPN7_9ASTE|nr:hypothetical protein F0562_013907 [Nyssa sinensis]
MIACFVMLLLTLCDFMVGLARGRYNVASAIAMEAYAMLDGLQLCVDSSIFSLVVESDCKTLVDLLQDYSASLSDIEAIIYDIQRVAKIVGVRHFSFVGCMGNQVAHVLTHRVSFDGLFDVWIENTPLG